MAVRHDLRQITLNVFLAGLFAGASDVQGAALIDTIADSDLNGEDYAIYSNPTEVLAAFDAGYLGTVAKNLLISAFAQDAPVPSRIIVANYDGATEDPSDAFARMLDAGLDFVAVACTSVTASDQIALSNAVEADKDHVCGILTSDTGGLPAGLSGIAENEWTYAVYHETAAEHPEFLLASQRTAFNPERNFYQWEALIRGLTANANVTSTVATALEGANISYAAPFGTRTLVSEGRSLTGRPVEELITAILFQRRAREAAVAMKTDYVALGQAIPVDTEGQVLVEGRVIRPTADNLLSTGRVTAVSVSRPAITSADLTALRVPATVELTVARSGRKITINAYFKQPEAA